ncbi:Smr domain-containing protein [Mycena venus]|uniref:Smr domain-containing protein n=1 Tax=Mycena venus TaxID=2733690 RepID=A0A8H6XS26_9AGAR|nr:Smr domain-containing protein [Mycena venus]
MEAIFETLQREFCPPLDSSLLAALLADIDLDAPEDLKQSQIAAMRNTLIELAVHADESQPGPDSLDFSYSDETSTSSFPDFCTTTTTTSASDLSGGSARSAPFNSPLGFLQAALPHIPTQSLLRALAEADVDEDALDMWEIISAILSEETEKEMRERDLNEEDMKEMAEAAWETNKINLSDVRQQQHARAGPSSARPRVGGIDDPWAQLASLSTHVAQLLPPHPPSFFLSFFHSPEHARTPYSALCAALAAISTTRPRSSTSLDMLLPAYTLLDPGVLVADLELAMTAAQGRGEDAFELVKVLRDLDADAESGAYEMGVYHTPVVSPTSPLSTTVTSPMSAQFRPQPARALSAPLPTGPAPTPPPPNLKPPPAPPKANGGWQTVSGRTRARVEAPYPHAMHIPAYTRDVNGVRVRGSGNNVGKGGKGDEGMEALAPTAAASGESMRRRDELLREAARMWQRGNKRTRGGEVAFYFAERAREFQEVARREALQAARMMVQSRRHDGTPDTVDLHGVTAAEAVVIVNEILSEGGWSADKPLKIITGRGSHSAGQVSVLKPAVKKALEEDGWVVGTWDAGVTVRGRRGGRG